MTTYRICLKDEYGAGVWLCSLGNDGEFYCAKWRVNLIVWALRFADPTTNYYIHEVTK